MSLLNEKEIELFELLRNSSVSTITNFIEENKEEINMKERLPRAIEIVAVRNDMDILTYLIKKTHSYELNSIGLISHLNSACRQSTKEVCHLLEDSFPKFKLFRDLRSAVSAKNHSMINDVMSSKEKMSLLGMELYIVCLHDAIMNIEDKLLEKMVDKYIELVKEDENVVNNFYKLEDILFNCLYYNRLNIFSQIENILPLKISSYNALLRTALEKYLEDKFNHPSQAQERIDERIEFILNDCLTRHTLDETNLSILFEKESGNHKEINLLSTYLIKSSTQSLRKIMNKLESYMENSQLVINKLLSKSISHKISYNNLCYLFIEREIKITEEVENILKHNQDYVKLLEKIKLKKELEKKLSEKNNKIVAKKI